MHRMIEVEVRVRNEVYRASLPSPSPSLCLFPLPSLFFLILSPLSFPSLPFPLSRTRTYREERFMRPRLEPIDDSAINKCWELPHPRPEGVSYRREGEDHVQIASEECSKREGIVVNIHIRFNDDVNCERGCDDDDDK